MKDLTFLKPESELVREALDGLVESELARFAIHLQTARTLWRQHRDLVEAAQFPEHLRAAFIAECGNDPDEDDDCNYGQCDPVVAREEKLPSAHEVARAWMERAWTEATNGQPLEIV